MKVGVDRTSGLPMKQHLHFRKFEPTSTPVSVLNSRGQSLDVLPILLQNTAWKQRPLEQLKRLRALASFMTNRKIFLLEN
jgi:hypothetical protein